MERLLYRGFQFTTADVRKNILLPFELERDYDRLAVHLRYGPKAIRDPAIILPQIEQCVRKYYPPGYTLTAEDRKEYGQLYNFVTLSVDKDGAYVGCAHRHDPDQTILLSAAGSSWGFAPAAAGPGHWRVVLHVQAVVAGTVDCTVEIQGLGKGEEPV